MNNIHIVVFDKINKIKNIIPSMIENYAINKKNLVIQDVVSAPLLFYLFTADQPTTLILLLVTANDKTFLVHYLDLKMASSLIQ